VERELVERAGRGDRAAFDEVVRRRIDGVHRTAMAILGNHADAQDAVQDAFVLAWRRLPTLRDPARFDAWLGRILVNACRMVVRARPRVREVPVDLMPAAAEPTDRRATSFDTDLLSADAFDRAFARLTVDQRAVLVLHHYDDLPIADIAARLGIPAGTVKSRLHHARLALERSLAREAPR
jgi:RNA polymerase sigma-70 factor (ECF subfamily)